MNVVAVELGRLREIARAGGHSITVDGQGRTAHLRRAQTRYVAKLDKDEEGAGEP